MNRLRLYFDNSVLNRPFDDQKQPRVWLETLAFALIFTLIEAGESDMIVSDMHEQENDASPFLPRRSWVEKVLGFGTIWAGLNDSTRERARVLQQLGLKPVDSFHAALAEGAQASHFLTCDDRLLRRYSGALTMVNPQTFITLTHEYEN